MSRIFVTGGTGHAGAPVVAELIERGHQVSALVRGDAGPAGARLLRHPLSEAWRAAEEIAACDAVLHLACARSCDAEDVIGEDIAGTHYLLQAWSRGAFVFTSSQTWYGRPTGPLCEGQAPAPQNWYDLSKITGELQLEVAAREPSATRGPAVSLRMALLFGPDVRPGARQFLAPIFQHVAAGGAWVFGSHELVETAGSSFIGDRDFARAVVDAMGVGASGPYNLAGGLVTWHALLHAIGRRLGCAPRIVVRAGGVVEGAGERSLPQSRSLLDTGRLAAAIGFAPRQRLDELLDAAAATWRTAA